MQTKRINPLLIWYYKLKKRRRVKAYCPNCSSGFLLLTNWYDKKAECPFCSNDEIENDDFDELD